jgi:hypothetical protein
VRRFSGEDIAFAINEQFDKILLSKLLLILQEAGGTLFRYYKSWVLFMVCIEQYTLGIEPFFSAILMIKCTTTYAM